LSRRGSRQSVRNRRLAESAVKKDLRLRFILPAFALVLAAWPVYSLLPGLGRAVSPSNATGATSAKPAVKLSSLDTFQSLQISADSLAKATVVGDRLQSPLVDGGTIRYNLDVELQDKVSRYLAASRVPYGVFVAIEPKTGRVLGMVSHSSVNPAWKQSAYYQIYPMASLFKIITASAALEQKKVSPETVVAFNGRLTSVDPRYWDPRGRRSPEMSLTEAMGKSVNPVFGRVASEYVGRDQLVIQANRFGFNQPLFPGTSIRPSTALPPQSDAELKLMGAGLGREVKISPIHAAAMMAAVANRGVMMTPLLADRVTSGSGESLYSATPMELRRMLSEESAAKLAKMLSTTVNSGTSRRAFHDRRGRPMLAKLNVAAKTGSIDGKEPEGQYSWFAAYAPMEDPQIALVALVVNQGKWNIKASNVGEKALEAFFR
ncbi:MAG TPA: penicillin-binding transpeptidase domain-containing protein, partial [Geobacteraceae bacterium]|nr:penicillin-binding transpeptidase domain-containing protein [Geobacteraceae bacterium]